MKVCRQASLQTWSCVKHAQSIIAEPETAEVDTATAAIGLLRWTVSCCTAGRKWKKENAHRSMITFRSFITKYGQKSHTFVNQNQGRRKQPAINSAHRGRLDTDHPNE